MTTDATAAMSAEKLAKKEAKELVKAAKREAKELVKAAKREAGALVEASLTEEEIALRRAEKETKAAEKAAKKEAKAAAKMAKKEAKLLKKESKDADVVLLMKEEKAAKAAKKAADKKAASDPALVLTEAELTEWSAVASLLQSLSPEMTETAADTAVRRAFGWGTQKWWRGDVVREPPSVTPVLASLAFLRDELGLSDDEIAGRMLKRFPEIVRLPVERMRANVELMRTTYPVMRKETVLRVTVVEQPNALGFDVDCGGDCKSECAHCWVRFE